MMYLLYRLGRVLALGLPLGVTYKIAVFAADVYWIFAYRDKGNLKCNLGIVLGRNDEKLIKKYAREIFRNFAKYLVDFFRFSKLTDEDIKNSVTITGRENLDAALAEGKGVIAISAHIGNWELGAAIIARMGYPLHALVLDHRDKRINDFFINQRSACSIRVLSLASELKNCFRMLRRNELLAIAGDKDYTQSGIRVDFFGRPAVLPKGAARFSLKTGAPIVPTFLIRRPGDRFDLTFEKPVKGEHAGNKEADIRGVMKKYFSVFEKYITAYPGQWYAFGKVWE